MNPMSLLTLSADTLRDAAQRHEPVSSCAERTERRTAAVVTGLVLTAVLGALFLLV